MGKRTWGTETSKYPEEKKSTEIPLVAASERGPAQTDFGRGCGASHMGVTKVHSSRTVLERPARDGDSPVRERVSPPEEYPSTAGHVKSGGNLGGPSPKAKYYSLTDSERVPRGKGEKYPG